MTYHKHQRTNHAATTQDGMKLHLRLITIQGYPYRVLTLRPGTQAAYSTNYFHATWHIISDMHGARLLARLLWGLAYQRQPNTLILLHGEHLLPTPFDAAPSDPILLAVAPRTALCKDVLRDLKSRLKHPGPPTRTVRWHTFGLDAALEDVSAYHAQDYPQDYSYRINDIWKQERMQHWGGFICYTAPPVVLRNRAVDVHQLHTANYPDNADMDYRFLADRGEFHSPDGEVQIFNDYSLRLKEAAIARQKVLASPDRPPHPGGLSETICNASARLRYKRLNAPVRPGRRQPKIAKQASEM